MSDEGAKVVSRSLSCIFDKPIAGTIIADEMNKILNHLGQHLNYRGKIIGHLKIMAEAGGEYVQMSLTSLPDITTRSGPAWFDKSYEQVALICNIIVFGYEKNRLEMLLEEGLSQSVFKKLHCMPNKTKQEYPTFIQKVRG